MAESKEVEWLQYFDNTTNTENEEEETKPEDKTFNTNNVQGIKYNPYRITLSNEATDSKDNEDIQLLSVSDIDQLIKDYQSKHNAKVCRVCGEHFQSYVQRDMHDSNRMYQNAKACKPLFNIKHYDKSKVNQEFHSSLTVYIHFTRKRLDQIGGLKAMLIEKLKDEVELLPSNLFPSKLDEQDKQEEFVCFAIPIFSFDAVNKCLYFAMITSYDLEIWYQALYAKNRDYTPQSKCLPLEIDELDAMQALYTSTRYKSALKPDENSILARITRKLDKVIAEFTDQLNKDKQFNNNVFSIGEYFVKLSTRSPKDGTDVNYKTFPDTTRVQRIMLMVEKMKVKEAKQCMILFSKSKRVCDDIGFYRYYRVSFAHPLNIVVRSFFKNLNPIFEFRCFVHQKELNAISQYLCYDVFKELQDEALVANIRKLIVEFHNETKVVLPYSDYVLDVFVDVEMHHCTRGMKS